MSVRLLIFVHSKTKLKQKFLFSKLKLTDFVSVCWPLAQPFELAADIAVVLVTGIVTIRWHLAILSTDIVDY